MLRVREDENGLAEISGGGWVGVARGFVGERMSVERRLRWEGEEEKPSSPPRAEGETEANKAVASPTLLLPQLHPRVDECDASCDSYTLKNP